MIRVFVMIIGLMLSAQTALALNAEEMLEDQGLENRARVISAQMRCLACQNQSIDDSEAGLAKDLRAEIRRLLSEGQSDTEIISAIQQKYGDYVLLNPPMKPETLLLWLSPLLIMLIGGGVLWQHFRKQKSVVAEPVVAVMISQAKPLNKKNMFLMFSLVFVLSSGGYFALERFGVVGNYQESARVKQQIIGMVEGLAARLQDNPDDLEGWQKLARAYGVLEQPKKTIGALIDIARLMPNDWQAQISPLEMILAQALSMDYQAPAQEILARLAAIDSERLEYLFFAGHYAKLDGKTAQARDYWQKLYNRLPEGSPILQQVKQEIENLG